MLIITTKETVHNHQATHEPVHEELGVTIEVTIETAARYKVVGNI